MNTGKVHIENNSIYDKNMLVLREFYPEIAARVDACPVHVDYLMKGSGVNQWVNLYSVKNNQYYYNEEEPLKEIEKQFQDLKIKNARIAVFLGFGLGYEVRHYAEFYAQRCRTELF